MDIKKRIQELSLDQKAKLYYMGLVKKGEIDTLPEDPKAAYVQSMMDEPASSKFSEPMGETRDEEDEENDRNLASDDIPDSLRELSTELGYLEEVDGMEKRNYQNLPYTHEILLNDIDIETLKSSFPEYYQNEKFIRPQTGEPYYSDNISFPNPDDSMSRIGDPESLEDWKDKINRRFGDVIIKFNNKAKNWFDKVFVDDDAFNAARDRFIRGKMSAMQRDQELGRSID